MRLAATTLAIIAFAIQACATGTPGPPTANPALSPVELISRAQELNGKIVTVEGYFTFRTDTRALWQSRSAWQDVEGRRRGERFDYWSKCITIYWADDLPIRNYNDHWARFTGQVMIIQDDDMRAFWTCNRTSVLVTSAR